MKHLLYLAMLATTAAGLAACSSDDAAEGGQNPALSGTVKTQFAINIPRAANGPATRMTDANTQNNNNFLGLGDISLFPLTAVPSATSTLSAITLGTPTDIFDQSTSTDADPRGFAKLYSNVEVPIGTNNFLFYALGTNTEQEGYKKGELTASYGTAGSATAADIKFKPTTLLTADNTTAFKAEVAARAAYLNAIATVQGFSSSNTLAGVYGLLAQNSSVRAVYSAQLLRWMNALYKACADAETNASDDDKTILTGVKEKIVDKYFKALDTPDNGSYITWKDDATDAVKNFPTNTYGLPDGVAYVACATAAADGNIFSSPYAGGQTPAANIDPAAIINPVSLAYWANTPVKANGTAYDESASTVWPQSISAWNSATWTDWTDFVNVNTKTVALVNPVNYGVACLKTTVKCQAPAGETQLDDNSTTKITIPTDGYKVTAILVGSQPAEVGWQFVGASGEYKSSVYDRDIPTGVKATATESSPNYTLLFDNYTTKQTGQEKPRMVVELTNPSTDDGGAIIHGVDGEIAPGQKFYLAAELDPTATTGVTDNISFTDAEKLRYPGYDAAATTPTDKVTRRVFMQDFTTEVKLTITSLKKAYVTIPDLTSVKLNLGLAVDLKWRSGLTFSISEFK